MYMYIRKAIFDICKTLLLLLRYKADFGFKYTTCGQKFSYILTNSKDFMLTNVLINEHKTNSQLIGLC